MVAQAGIKAGFVFLFMAFLALQATTGFMRDMFVGGVYPRTMRALGGILETVVTGPLGNVGGAILLLILGCVFAALVWRRAMMDVSK